MLLRDDDGNSHIGVPIKFEGEPAAPDLNLPAYGADSEHLARETGLGEAAINTLKGRDAI